MLFLYLVTALHILVCVILVLVVLLQSGKGADLAGAFGGGATQTAFGSRGPASFLSKMTTVAAVVFMLTSITLSMMSSKTEVKSVLETKQETSKPAAEEIKDQSDLPAPTPEQIQKELEELEAKKEKQAEPAPKPEESD